MKTKILSILTSAAAILGLSACQDVYEFNASTYDEPFDSMTASFYDDDRLENNFPAEFDYVNHVITFVVPYTYPANTESYLDYQDLTRMRVISSLKNGCIITPAVAWLDLSKENYCTLTDGNGVATRYTIKCEIRKSAECEITDFVLPELSLTGVINTNANIITLVTNDEIGEQLANVETSHGATLEPDPREVALNYDNEPVIKCIAQNGVDYTEYKFVKAEPDKLPFGIRAGSAKIQWVKKHSDLGMKVFTAAQMSSGNTRWLGSRGVGITGDYLVLNDAGSGKAYVMKYKNGEVVKELDLTAMGVNTLGQYNNYRMTSDEGGNLLFCTQGLNNTGNEFALWKMNGIDGELIKIASTANYYTVATTLSVCGNLDKDAIITTCGNGVNGKLTFYRWVVKNGVVGACEAIEPQGYNGNCWGTYDVSYFEPNPNSDYLGIGYVPFAVNPPNSNVANAETRTCAWLDGNNSIKHYGSVCITSNAVENAGDLITFNNVRYYIHNTVNTLSYAFSTFYMYDLSTNDLSTQALKFDGTDVNFKDQYDAKAANGTPCSQYGNDVRFHVSPDGFYLYIFFEYTNGYVGCIRCDCIDM